MYKTVMNNILKKCIRQRCSVGTCQKSYLQNIKFDEPYIYAEQRKNPMEKQYYFLIFRVSSIQYNLQMLD